MSEYQRYEFMTVDKPLTSGQLEMVNGLSSHIHATSTHALIEYHWGDFKHDPLAVLRDYFDGFLYWANWGTPQLAFRFPHGVLSSKIVDGYDFDDVVTFKKGKTYDILDIDFSEMTDYDEIIDVQLASLISIREELMDGDLRSIYIVWLAVQDLLGRYEEDEEEYDPEPGAEGEHEDYEIYVPPVPPNLGKLTSSQKVLMRMLQLSPEILKAAAKHSTTSKESHKDDLAALITLLPQDRGNDYLLRLAHNEKGLNRLLLKELRELKPEGASAKDQEGERVTYATLLAESKI